MKLGREVGDRSLLSHVEISRVVSRHPACPIRAFLPHSRVVTEDRSTASAGALITDYEAYLFGEGRWLRAWEKMGARPAESTAPAATRSSSGRRTRAACRVVGDFNGWDGRAHPMRSLGASGLWEIFVPGLGEGALYKFEIQPRHGPPLTKSDPFALRAEAPPQHRVGHRDARRARVARRRVDGRAARARHGARSADGDLRSASRDRGGAIPRRASAR